MKLRIIQGGKVIGRQPRKQTLKGGSTSGPPNTATPATPAPPEDHYYKIAVAYAKASVADTRFSTHGRLMVAACQRFLNDLERADEIKAPFMFSMRQSFRFCRFIELMPHVEGKWSTTNIELIPAQIFFIVNLFGFRNYVMRDDKRVDIGRRFTTALYAVARKNAKSTLAAAILLACKCLEDEVGPQIISAATTGQQARIVWTIAKRMVEKTNALRVKYLLRAQANAIQCDDDNGGIIKPINAKASTQDGLNPSAVNLDELHAHQTPDLLNVLMSAAGGRSNPLWLFTTTEGYDTPGPWPEQRDFAESVLKGVVEADHYLACIFRIDDEDDDFDEEKWVKANPLMENNPLLLTTTRRLAIEAKAMPGRLSEFRIKRLNRRASVALGWIDLLKWRDCRGKVDLDKLAKSGAHCWAAIDMASNVDMTAWRLLWELDGVYYTWGRYWVPAKAVKMRTVRNTVPYQAWIDAKWLQLTDGNTTDYEQVKKDIIADCKRFNPRKVGYDTWNANQLSLELLEEDIPMEMFVQGTKSYNPAMKSFEREYLEGNLVHDGNPILTWNMANVVAAQDTNQNIKPDRKKSKEKIDGAVSLFMAFGLADADDRNDGYVSSRIVTA